MFAKRKAREAAKVAAAAAAATKAECERIEGFLEAARTFFGADPHDIPTIHAQLHAGESLYMCVEGASLVEPRRGAGQWEGRSQGVSVRVPGTRSVRYRVGASRGHFVQGQETPTAIDQGEFVITDKRALFIGPKQTREWVWSKLVGIDHAAEAPWTSIAVSNRQKTSGVLYDRANEDEIRFRIDLAVRTANGTRDELVKELTEELTAAQAELPAVD